MAELLNNIAVIIALLAVILLFFRLAIGPSLADRAVALDSLTIVSISIIAFISHFTARVIYLDVAMVYTLISFLGILALARFLERGI